MIAVYLSDNGIAPFSIAARVKRSAFKEVIPLLIKTGRISSSEWSPRIVEYEMGSDVDDVSLHPFGKERTPREEDHLRHIVGTVKKRAWALTNEGKLKGD